MPDAGRYLMTIVAASMACALAAGLVSEKHTAGKILKMLCGILLALTVASPLTTFRIHDLERYYSAFAADAEEAVSVGRKIADGERSAIIKSSLEAYILDKAEAMGAHITVSVMLSDDLMTPESAEICGRINPYTRQQLSALLAEQLGIAKENQIWMESR